MEETFKKIIDILINSGIKIIEAILILWIGLKIIKFLIKAIKKSKIFNKIEKSLQTFLLSFINTSLKIILFVSVASFIV